MTLSVVPGEVFHDEPLGDLSSLALSYHRQRGTRPRGNPTGRKLLEETGELLVELAAGTRLTQIHEIADVAICLEYIARSRGVTVEECIVIKTAKDKGRNINTDDWDN